MLAVLIGSLQADAEELRGQRSVARLFSDSWLLERGRMKNFGLDTDWTQTPRRYRTWLRVFGNWSRMDDDRSMDLEYYSYGTTIGIDQQIGRRFLLGASLGGTRISAQEAKIARDDGQKCHVSAAHGSVYFRTTLDRIYFDLEGGLGYNDQTRPSRNTMQWNIHGEAGTWWGHGLAKIEPFLGLRHVSLDVDPGTESKTTLVGGVRYSWKTTGRYSVTTPRLYGGILHELGDRELISAALFVDSPTVFTVPGYEIAKTRFFFGAGITSAMGRSLDLYIRYTGESGSDYVSHTTMLGMNWNY